MIECPYCLAEIIKPDEARACESCGALYHAECWVENGGCCVKECPAVRRNIEIEAPEPSGDRLVISHQAAEKAIPHSTRKARNPCLRCGREVPEGQLYCRDCAPGREDSQDAENTGPLLLAFLLLVLALGSIIVLGALSSDKQDKSNPTRIENKLKP